MAFDAFLKIDGISGESTDDKHKDWIEILSFNHSMMQPNMGAVSAKGAHTTGRVDISDFSVVKHLDKASPKLALACCKGEHIGTVTVELCRAGGDKQKYMEYKFSDVLVSQVRPSGTSHGESTPMEEASFRFGKIEWTYTALDQNGKPKGNVAAKWDLEANKGA